MRSYRRQRFVPSLPALKGAAGEALARGANAFADDDLVPQCGNNPPKPHAPHQWAGIALTVATHLTNFAVAVGGELGEALLSDTRSLLLASVPAKPGPAARRLMDIAKSDPMPAKELRAALRDAHLEQVGIQVNLQPASR